MTDVLFSPAAAAAFELLVRATLLIAAAWAGAAALRAAGASAAARHMAWLLGIAALLALPLLWWLAPALLLPILPESASLSALAAPPPAAASPAIEGSAAPASPFGWLGLLALGYALVAAFLLLRIAFARCLLARLWSESESVPDRDWRNLLSALSLEIGLPRPVELRIASGPFMPMTWGTLAPKVLLPAESLSWSPERRRLVLLHELAHVSRRDSLSRSIASLACALYWFHPGAWFAARRLGIEQEHAADDRVLLAGGSAPAYARSLLHLATPPDARLSPAHAASMAGMYQLERRLLSIVNPAPRDRPTAWFFASSALTASLATVAIASAIPVASSPLPSHPPRVAAAPAGGALHARAETEKVTAGAPGEAADPPESAPAALGAQPLSRRVSPYGRAEAQRANLEPDAGSGAGQAPNAQAAEHGDPAASGLALTGPTSPAIPVQSTLLIVPSAASGLEARAADRSPFRLASYEAPAPSAASANVPRALVDGMPVKSNRIASWKRFSLSSSWAQPSLP